MRSRSAPWPSLLMGAGVFVILASTAAWVLTHREAATLEGVGAVIAVGGIVLGALNGQRGGL